MPCIVSIKGEGEFPAHVRGLYFGSQDLCLDDGRTIHANVKDIETYGIPMSSRTPKMFVEDYILVSDRRETINQNSQESTGRDILELLACCVTEG